MLRRVGSSQDRPEQTFIALTKRTFANDLQGLFQAGEDVEALLAHPGWTHVAGLVDAEVRGIDDKLDSTSRLFEHVEYARDHGRRGGLRAFTEAARAIVSEAARQREQQQRKHERTAGSVLEA